MKSSEYWQNRMNSIEQSRFESAFKAYKSSEKAFTAAQRQLDQQIEVWINRIAVNNEVSYTEARKLLKGAELEEFKWGVEQYIAAGRENAVSQQWMKQLENASARAHISRLEAMKVELQQQIETAYGVQQSATADLLTTVYEDSYYHTAYEVQKGVGVGWEIGGVNEKVLDRAVNGWATDEKSFSDRIWSNRTQMVNELQQQLTAQIATGAAPDDAIAALEKYVDSSIKSAKSKAGTLVMTESAAIGNAAQMDAYKELGVEEYEIVETLDSLTCSTCGAWDGQHFPIDEFQIGATAPPFHPNCRGCTAPWFDDDEEVGLVGERVARDDDGDRYYVPGNMDYEEWKDKFVDGGDKSDLDAMQEGGTSGKQTGGRAFDSADRQLECDEKAVEYYEKVRGDDSDIEAIAKNTGHSEAEVRAVKDHVFFNTHVLDDGVRRFDEDYNMAVAWQRMINGQYEDRDILLFNHEYLESQVEKKYNLTYREAHAIAEEQYAWDIEIEHLFGGYAEDVRLDDLIRKT